MYDYENGDEIMFPSQIMDSFQTYSVEDFWSIENHVSIFNWEWDIDHFITNMHFEEALDFYINSQIVKKQSIEFLKICEVVSPKIHFVITIKLVKAE